MVQRFTPLWPEGRRQTALHRVRGFLAAMLKTILARTTISGPNPVSMPVREQEALFRELIEKACTGERIGAHRVVQWDRLSSEDFQKLMKLRKLQSG